MPLPYISPFCSHCHHLRGTHSRGKAISFPGAHSKWQSSQHCSAEHGPGNSLPWPFLAAGGMGESSSNWVESRSLKTEREMSLIFGANRKEGQVTSKVAGWGRGRGTVPQPLLRAPGYKAARQRPRQLLSPSYTISDMVGGRLHRTRRREGKRGSQLLQPEYIDYLGAAGLSLRKLLSIRCFGPYFFQWG